MGSEELSKPKKKRFTVTEVYAASEVNAKARGVEQFDDEEAPEDEETRRRIIEENVIDEVGDK